MHSWVSFVLVLAACSYTPPGGAPDEAAPPDGATADPGSDPGTDAPGRTPSVIYIGSETQFGIFDIATKSAMIVGPFLDASNDSQLTMYELAMDSDGSLLGITAPPTAALYRIDTSTGKGTKISDLADTSLELWGATTAPAGTVATDAVVFGGTPGGELWRIRSTDGALSDVGSFGSGFGVSGDLAWVDGIGLVGTLDSGSCDDCLAKISPTDGTATTIKNLGMGDCYAIGSVAGRLFVFRGSETAYELDPATGDVIDNWALPGAVWSVAAP